MPNLKQTNYGVDSDFESYEEALARAVAGSMPTFSISGAALHKGHHVVLKGRPVRILSLTLSISKVRGISRKMHILSVDIFTDEQLEEIRYVKDFIDAPVLTRTNYTLGGIDAPILNLLTDDGESKDDVNLPRGPLGERLAADFALGKDLTVTTLSALGEEQVESYKEAVDEGHESRCNSSA